MREHLGEYYDRTSDFQQAQFDVLRDLIIDTIPNRNEIKTLLDIGSGSGARTYQCLDLFPNLESLIAIEPDWEMIATAQKKYSHPKINYIKMSGEELAALSDQKFIFDAVISNWSIHWVSGKTEMMKQINRLTHKNSKIIFSTCEKLPHILSFIDQYVKNVLPSAPKQTPYHYLTMPEWKKLFTENGWKTCTEITYELVRKHENADDYIKHWFTASATKFLYGKHLGELSDLTKSDLSFTTRTAYPSKKHAEGLCFTEDVMFVIAERE